MSARKSTSATRPKNGSFPARETDLELDALEVLTLTEAADYLRVAEKDILRLARNHDLPGREIGGAWRFLKAALRDWLRTPIAKSSKEAFLSLAGVWKDDPDIDHIVRQALGRRGRPVRDNPS
jgi:excisionase family DNA binding protein